MKLRNVLHVGQFTVVLTGIILTLSMAIQMGCSDQLVGLDESTLATRQASDAIASQLERYVKRDQTPTDSTSGEVVPNSANSKSQGGATPVDSSSHGKPGDSLKIFLPPAAKDSVIVFNRGGKDTGLVLTPTGVDSAMVTRSGKTIMLTSLGNGAEFRVGKDALLLPTQIKVGSSRSRSDELLCIELNFGPDGLRFGTPATLVLPDSLFLSNYGQLPTTGYWLWFDPVLGEWSLTGEALVGPDHTFQIPVEHFSSYRLVVTPAIGISQGGQN